MRPEQTDSPLRQLYLQIQAMHLDAAERDVLLPRVLALGAAQLPGLAAVDAALGAVLRENPHLRRGRQLSACALQPAKGRHADLAEESATLQSLQTKQQLGIQALSIANQQSGAVLSLFR